MSDNSYEGNSPKVFFSAGDLVTLKHDLENKPIMLVQTIDKTTFPRARTPMSGAASAERRVGGLLGVTCIWFSKDLILQSYRFNTKDLVITKP